MSKELKPCPFCSHTPMIFNQTGLVVCRYSMCSANPQANSKEDWNKRTTDLLEQENAELRDAASSLLDLFDGVVFTHNTHQGRTKFLNARNNLKQLLNK